MFYHQRQHKRSNKPGSVRREFARQCIAMATTAVSSSFFHLRIAQALAAAEPSEDYRALVCVYLQGGNDSFNMLVPRDTAEYADYSDARGGTIDGGLAIPENELLPIADPSGRSFGLHPSMTNLHTLYNQDTVAFVANVGSLVQPTDLTIFQADDDRLPLGLFSHADASRQWQTSMSRSRDDVTGWGGRMADILTDSSRRYDPISMSFGVNSTSIFQSAKYANPYTVSVNGAEARDGYNGEWHRDKIFRLAHKKMLARTERNLLKKTHSLMTEQAIQAAELYNLATQGVTINTSFPDHQLGSELEQVARTIAAHSLLDQKRQIFFISYGTWDHHSALLYPHSQRLLEMDSAFGAFQTCMEELGLAECVTTFTASDFGRTLSSNGQGSDHGWGGNQIVMGGSVDGGQIYGQYPLSLAIDNPLDVGRGSLIPTTSVDQYAAELALWFGVSNSDLESILPNIRTFYGPSESETPLSMFS